MSDACLRQVPQVHFSDVKLETGLKQVEEPRSAAEILKRQESAKIASGAPQFSLVTVNFQTHAHYNCSFGDTDRDRIKGILSQKPH